MSRRPARRPAPRPSAAPATVPGLAAGVLLSAALAGTPWAGPTAAAPNGGPAEDVERAEEWPELSGSAKSDARRDVARLRKARTFEMGEEAREALIAAGAGIVPLLLPTLGKEDDPDARERIDDVLTAVTSAAHTRLLAEEFGARDAAVRVWALRRAARFPDPGIRAAAEARWKALQEDDDADPLEVYAASLASASAGSLVGLGALMEAAAEEWQERREELLLALAGAQGPEATEAVLARMTDRDSSVAGLRLLWSCGDRSAALRIAKYLDDSDHVVRNAAINALRCAVDGDEPLEQLPVFEAIERAKKWKERL